MDDDNNIHCYAILRYNVNITNRVAFQDKVLFLILYESELKDCISNNHLLCYEFKSFISSNGDRYRILFESNENELKNFFKKTVLSTNNFTKENESPKNNNNIQKFKNHILSKKTELLPHLFRELKSKGCSNDDIHKIQEAYLKYNNSLTNQVKHLLKELTIDYIIKRLPPNYYAVKQFINTLNTVNHKNNIIYQI